MPLRCLTAIVMSDLFVVKLKKKFVASSCEVEADRYAERGLAPVTISDFFFYGRGYYHITLPYQGTLRTSRECLLPLAHSPLYIS